MPVTKDDVTKAQKAQPSAMKLSAQNLKDVLALMESEGLDFNAACCKVLGVTGSLSFSVEGWEGPDAAPSGKAPSMNAAIRSALGR
jgi:hypothetical protein